MIAARPSSVGHPRSLPIKRRFPEIGENVCKLPNFISFSVERAGAHRLERVIKSRKGKQLPKYYLENFVKCQHVQRWRNYP